MPVYDDQETKTAIPGSHDGLGVHPEHAEAEVADLEKQFADSPDEPADKGDQSWWDRRKNRDADSASAIADKEEAAEEPEQPTDDMLGKGFTGMKRRIQARGLAKLITRRNAYMAGGISALLFGGGIAVFTTSIPGLQAYNYSQILLTTTKHNQESSTITLGRLYRYMRTGSVGATRLNLLEYKMYPKMVTSLESTGVKILTERLTGQIRAVSIDPSKLSDLRGMSREEVGKYVSDRYGVKPSKVYIGADGGSIRFSMQDVPLGKRELFVKDIVRQNGAGKINSFIQMRLLRLYYATPSMFHPLQRAAAYEDMKKLELLRKSKTFRELEENRTAKIAARSNEAKARLASIKTKATSAAGAASAVLLAQGAICIAYDVAKEADIINQENYRDPAVKSGVDAAAVGEQIAASSPDVTKEAVEGYNDNMTDTATKTTPFDAAAIRALQGQTGGVPTDPSLRAAFSLSNSATVLVKDLETNFQAASVCSVGGQIVGGAAGIALVILGPGGWVMKGITTAASAAATQVAMNFIQSTVPKLIAEEPPIGIPHRGAIGGMFDAYGMRAAANEIAMSSGGVAIDASTALKRERQWQDEENKTWRNQSFFARAFTPSDYRSLAGRMVNSISPNLALQTSRTAATLASLPSSLLRLPGSLVSPNVTAQTAAFDWGFPVFDLPDPVLNDPKYADPYDNAEKTAVILDGPGGSGGIGRAKTCYGSIIAQEDMDGKMVWSARPGPKPNIYSPEYRAANCDQTTDDSWNRISAFVNSSRAMEAEACAQGREDSCQRVGQDSAVGGSGIPVTPSASEQPGVIDASTLFQSSASIACYDDPATPTTETRDAGIQDGYASGIKVPIRVCSIPGFKSFASESNPGNAFYINGADGNVLVNSRVSKIWYQLHTAAKSDGVALSADSSFRSMAKQTKLCGGTCDGKLVAKPGFSPHQMGLAIDFSSPSKKNPYAQSCETRVTQPGDIMWDWLEGHAARYGIRQYSAEAWHWDPLTMSNRCGGGSSV